MGKTIVDEGQKDRTKNYVANVYHGSCYGLNVMIGKLKSQSGRQNCTNNGRVDSITLKNYSHLSLRFVALGVGLVVEVVLKLKVFKEGFLKDFYIYNDYNKRY